VLEDRSQKEPVSSIRKIAVGKIRRTNTLFRIACTDPSAEIRALAASNIKDRNVREKIVVKPSSTDGLRADAGQSVLAEVARTHLGDGHRQKAVRYLTDQRALGGIALGHLDQSTREAAVGRLVDQSALSEVALTCRSGLTRRQAMKKVTNEDVLLQIARNDPDETIREEARDRLTDQTHLIELARNSSASWLRVKILERLSDSEALSFLLRYDADEWVRETFHKMPVTITGTLVNAEGNPIAKRRIYFIPIENGGLSLQFKDGNVANPNSESDESGRFVIEAHPRTGTFTVGLADRTSVTAVTSPDGNRINFIVEGLTRRVNLGEITVK
jgi:hypothetical protein